jgi:hypothetical protein
MYDSTVYKPSNQEKLKKLDFGVDVGVSYMVNSNGYGGPLFSLSPYVSYPVGKRFSVSAGVSVMHGNYYNPWLAESGGNNFLPMTRMFLYATGHYAINERLTLSSTVYKEIVDVPNRYPNQNNSTIQGQGASIGINYKITPNLSVGAQIRVEQPGLYSPYAPLMNPYGGNYTPNWW